MRRAFAVIAIGALLASCAAETASQTPAAVPNEPSRMEAAPDRGVAIGRARQDLEQAQVELREAQGDCARACKALASMERATQQLCDLASSPDDQRACEDARGKLDSSRKQVQSTCGDCST